MTPIQQLYLGLGAKKKTYIDDVFSTYLWTGSGSARSINNGINLSGEGGLVWIKERDGSNSHQLFDTIRGATKQLYSDDTNAEWTSTNSLTSFNNNGFSIGDNVGINNSGDDVASWSFRRASGFFDVVTYTGTGSTQNISHSLGCIPGMILTKCISTSNDWGVYHRGVNGGVNPEQYGIFLNSNSAQHDDNGYWNDTAPTATQFTVKNNGDTNDNGETYVAYLFAGGESTATTARSVAFDGDEDELRIDGSNDFDFGANDFTIECWVNPNSIAYTSYYKRLWSFGSADNNSMTISVQPNGTVEFRLDNSPVITSPANSLTLGSWSHVAVVRHSNKIKLYINGTQIGSSYSYSSTVDWSQSGEDLYIGTMISNDSSSWNGKISNFRIVKGTAVYTSPFRPPTEPLTNISNTVVLCCNNSSVTGKTVGDTIVTSGSPTASTDSPFDDPSGFVFGDGEDQNVIKCGSYVGDGNGGSSQGVANSQEIFLGFEPQWILIKRASAAESWILYDSMRGIVTSNANADAKFEVNNSDAESLVNHIELTSTGFTFTTGNNQVNADGDDYIFAAIRRPDGYVGKPVEAGTDVFTMAYGNSGGTNPSYVSNFPVDFALVRQPATSEAWYASSRLIEGKYLYTNTSNAEGTATNFVFDHNNGWRDGSAVTAYLSWMWKRHAGFDAATYTGNADSSGVVEVQHIPHNLGKTPEMFWIKKRDSGLGTPDWFVYHKDLSHDSSNVNHIKLNGSASEASGSNIFYNTLPTAYDFTVGGAYALNEENKQFIAMLFASVDGISKVGSYTGTGSDNTISLGFSARFIIIKRTDNSGNWLVLDTVRGINSGADSEMYLNSSSAAGSLDMVDLDGNNMVIQGSYSTTNANGSKYIYYAHA